MENFMGTHRNSTKIIKNNTLHTMGLNILSLLWDTIRSGTTHKYAAIRAAHRRHSFGVFWEDRSGYCIPHFLDCREAKPSQQRTEKHIVSISETIVSTIPWNGTRGYSAAGPITFIFIYMVFLTNLFVSFHYAFFASPLRHWPNAHLWRPKK